MAAKSDQWAGMRVQTFGSLAGAALYGALAWFYDGWARASLFWMGEQLSRLVPVWVAIAVGLALAIGVALLWRLRPVELEPLDDGLMERLLAQGGSMPEEYFRGSDLILSQHRLHRLGFVDTGMYSTYLTAAGKGYLSDKRKRQKP